LTTKTMNNEQYMKNLARLKEIEAKVKDPQVSLDSIDALLDETTKIVRDCYAYTRGLKDKVEALDSLTLQ